MADPALLDARVVREVHPDDQMFDGDLARYLDVGRDALAKVAAVQVMTGAGSPSSVLDFGCGHGRVGRYLRAAYPDAQLVGCDVLARALPFYRDTLGATTVLSSTRLEEVDLGRRFDLVWCGSVMTHLDEGAAGRLLDLFERHLADGGIAAFTVHGRFVANRWREADEWIYRLTRDQMKELAGRFEAGDYAYADYEDMSGYGISMTPLSWVLRRLDEHPSLRLVAMTERGWDDHQDLVAVRRVPAG